MKPAQIVVDVVAGGEIWAEEGRLMFRHAPARLIPLIREHKTALLALLESVPEADYYDLHERIAIQWESRLPPEEPRPDVPGFEGYPMCHPSRENAA